LYDWAKTTFENIHFDFIPEENYNKHEKTLMARFNWAKTIVGTQKSHSSIRCSDDLNKVQIRVYSESSDYTLRSVI
jgi:hypothetical protein